MNPECDQKNKNPECAVEPRPVTPPPPEKKEKKQYDVEKKRNKRKKEEKAEREMKVKNKNEQSIDGAAAAAAAAISTCRRLHFTVTPVEWRSFPAIRAPRVCKSAIFNTRDTAMTAPLAPARRRTGRPS